MTFLQNSTTPSPHPAIVGRPIVCVKDGLGFADLFGTDEHPIVRVPSRKQVAHDLRLLRRIRRELGA